MKRTVLLLAGATALIFLPHTVLAEDVMGLFISLKLNDAKSYQQWHDASRPTFKAHNCVPLRSGKLAGGKGTLQWGASDYFSLMKCQTPVLSDLVDRGFINSLSAITDELNLTEGNLEILSDKRPPPNSEYLIKISYFNNLNSKARQKGLSKIESHAKKAENAWIDDAILQPRSAVGVIQPDNLTFLYYSKIGQGEQFRKSNPDLMNKIGSFNQAHLEHFIYLPAQLKNRGMK